MSRKACLVGPVHPYRGGIAHFTSLLAGEFSKDHEVLVVSFRRLYPSIFFPGKTQFDESGNPLAAASVRAIDSMNPASFPRAARIMADLDPDIVVFQWWHPFFAPAFALIQFFAERRKRGISSRTAYLCHNVTPHEASAADRVLTRLAFRRVPNFLVQSREDRERLLAIRPGANVAVNVHPTYEVFNAGRYTREQARRELGVGGPMVLFFGYVRPYKGLGVLIDGFAKAAERLGGVLFIVGEFYEGREKYDRRIQELGIADRIRIVDRYVSNEEVEKYFAACDLVVLPYLSATQSGVVQIAYGFDKPVIVTSVGGLPDVVEDGHTGHVVPPNDPDALARSMLVFFEKGESEGMARNIASIKDRFSWGRCKQALLDLVGGGAAARR